MLKLFVPFCFFGDESLGVNSMETVLMLRLFEAIKVFIVSKKAMMNLPKSMNLFDCKCCESDEVSLDDLPATSRQPSLQPILIDLGINLSFRVVKETSIHS